MKRLATYLVSGLLLLAVNPAIAQARVIDHHHKTHVTHVHRAKRLPPKTSPAVTWISHPASVLPPIGATFPAWGNLSLPDCTFAAVANWETITFGQAPSEATVIQQFDEAGGSSIQGVNIPSLTSFWFLHGIGDTKEMLTWESSAYFSTLMQNHEVVIATVRFHSGETVGSHSTAREGLHALVVYSTNQTGPEIVTWGEAIQITWAQWEGWQPEIYLPLSEQQTTTPTRGF